MVIDFVSRKAANWGLLLIAAPVLVVIQASPTLASAQSNGTGGAAAKCMAKLDSPLGELFVPERYVTALEAKGLAVVACPPKFRSTANVAEYRNNMCRLAAVLTVPRQDEFEASFGERPAVLCGMAEYLFGRWRRE